MRSTDSCRSPGSRSPRRAVRAGGVVLAGVGLAAGLAAGAGPVAAHEERTAGGVRLDVGWGDEPAYTGVRNSVQVVLTEAATGQPVSGAGGSLQVVVSKGSDAVTLPLVADGSAGDHRAWLIPTRPGAYTFRVTGTIRGQAVDESFTSGPSTFNEVEEAAAIQFPVKDPSAGELATRIDREVPRLGGRLEVAEAEAQAATSEVDGARTLSLIGLVSGLAGLAAGGAALVSARRRPGGRRDRYPGRATGRAGPGPATAVDSERTTR